jgi:hypothetical protein
MAWMPGRGIKEGRIPDQMGHSSSHQVECGSVKNQTNLWGQSDGSDELQYCHVVRVKSITIGTVHILSAVYKDAKSDCLDRLTTRNMNHQYNKFQQK